MCSYRFVRSLPKLMQILWNCCRFALHASGLADLVVALLILSGGLQNQVSHHDSIIKKAKYGKAKPNQTKLEALFPLGIGYIDVASIQWVASHSNMKQKYIFSILLD
ncbi:hypothetical protein Dimus_028582 [Dionaea muscipula]